MKKYALIPLIVLVALFAGAGKYKISKVGQPDVYVPTLDSDAKTLTVENITGPGSVPIGGMVAVMPNIDASNAWQPPSSGVIKDGFMRADGVTIAASHRNAGCKLAVGTKLPNMVNSYPRGNTTSTDGTTGTGGANTQAGSTTIDAHSITQPGISNHALAANNIPQVTGSYTPTGYNDASAISSGAASSSGSNHSHQIAHSTAGGFPSPSPYVLRESNAYGAANSTSPNTQSDGGHSHTVTGTANAQAFHGYAATIYVGTVGPTAVTHSMTNVGVGNHTLTDNAVNNEPAYVETVWVIRVK